MRRGKMERAVILFAIGGVRARSSLPHAGRPRWLPGAAPLLVGSSWGVDVAQGRFWNNRAESVVGSKV